MGGAVNGRQQVNGTRSEKIREIKLRLSLSEHVKGVKKILKKLGKY